VQSPHPVCHKLDSPVRTVQLYTSPPIVLIPGEVNSYQMQKWSISITPPAIHLLQWESSWYSDGLRAGRLRGRSLSLGRVKDFHFSMLSRPVLGPTQPPIRWVPWAHYPRVKWLGCKADHTPLQQLELRSRKHRSIHPLPIWLHGIVHSYLKTGTPLPLPYLLKVT
jgi:hypothetical protein